MSKPKDRSLRLNDGLYSQSMVRCNILCYDSKCSYFPL